MLKVFVDGKFVNITDEEIEYGAYAAVTMMGESIKRVRELHKAIEVGTQYGDNFGDLGCPVCNELYPCPTIKALDGEQ